MTYKPTPQDAASDLLRCIYASLSKEGFKNPNFETFFSHALKVIDQCGDDLDPRILGVVKRCLSRAKDPNLEEAKAREDLLTAASLLRG